MGKKKKLFRRNVLRAKKAASTLQPTGAPTTEGAAEEKPKVKAKAKSTRAKAKKTSKKRTYKKRSPKK